MNLLRPMFTMKKYQLLAVVLLITTTTLPAQNTMQALFAGNVKLTFLGVDFTRAKYVGADGFTDPAAIENQHIKSWNSLLVLEPNKYSLQKAFKIKDESLYETNIDEVTRINTQAKVEPNITETPHSLTEADVAKMVSAYQPQSSEGVGIVYIAENLNKNAQEFTVWVTFLDMSNRKVLHTERIVAKPGGFGFRNYWAGAVYKVNKAIESKLYKQWSKQFRS